MPKQVDAALQREEIRSAARRVFARRGVRGVGLTHVAEAAGMGRSSLYHYYPDKESLLRDLVRDALAHERALFHGALTGPGSPRARIEGLMEGCARLFPEWAALGRMLFDLRLGDAREFRRFFREVREELAGVIREGQATGEISADLDPQLTAATLIGAIDGLLLQKLSDPKALADAEALSEALRTLTGRICAP